MQTNYLFMGRRKKPPKPYSEVKSGYIKEKIRQMDSENEDKRSYIHALIWLEKCILEDKPAGWPTGMMLQNIIEEHSGEFTIIKRELSPGSVKRTIMNAYVSGVEESLELENWELEGIIERLEDEESWREIKQSA